MVSVHRHAASCTGPRSCSCTATWPDGARGGAAGARALRAGDEPRPRPQAVLPARARSTACAASSTRPRRPTARRAARGWEPQPGLALLRRGAGERRGRGRGDPPRCSARPPSRLQRAGLLPAAVEIMLAAGDLAARARRVRGAAGARRALGRAACSDAMAAHARGAVELAGGRRRRRRWSRCGRRRRAWQELDAPYEAARDARAGRAWPAARVGDDDTAALELDAAREVVRAARRGARSRAARQRRALPTRTG